MKISPMAAPTAPSPTSSSAADSRARAIAKLTSAPPQASEQPVPDATRISPEEMGAIKASAPTDTSEAQAPEVTEEPAKAKEDPLSSQYANLARKEKALRAQIAQFKAEQDKFKSERESFKAPEVDTSRYIDSERLRSDPLAVLSEAGLSYDEITQHMLNATQMQTDPRITAQLARMEAEIKAANAEAKALRDLQENSQKQSYDQAVAQIRNEASKLAYTDPAFEMIKATNSVSDVVELIESTFKAEGTLLSVEEAMEAVEEHLLEEAMKLAKLEKLQKRLGQSTAPKPSVTEQKQPQTSSAKTLTNAMSTPKPMSARDRAIAAMEGKLKA